MEDSMRRSEGWKPSECAGSKQTKASEVLAGAGEQVAVKIAAAPVELLRERRGAERSRRALHAPASALRAALEVAGGELSSTWAGPCTRQIATTGPDREDRGWDQSGSGSGMLNKAPCTVERRDQRRPPPCR